MSTSLPTTPAWLLTGQTGTSSLKFVEDFAIPPLGDNDVLVEIHAAALNYRELAIAQGKFNLPLTPPKIPSSDGSGIIRSLGPSVTTFTPGDKVVIHLTTHQEDNTPATFSDVSGGLGQGVNGTLAKYAVFHESSLVRAPETLGFREAATLTCSGLTGWNALFGLQGPPKVSRQGMNGGMNGHGDGHGHGHGVNGEEKGGPGSRGTVLVQGTGGVSIAALQFALAANYTVIATTSSDTKTSRLTSLGASHVINYKTTPNWGEVAKSLTPGGRGVDIVVDVGGPSTVAQSLKAVRADGLVSLTGLLGGSESVPSIMDGLTHLCVTRGFLLGTRKQFREMNAFIDEMGIKPVVDERVFAFSEVKEAYEYLDAQRHFSKVVIDVE